MTASSKSPNCVRSVETKMAAKNDADESSDASVRRVLGATTAQDDTTEPLQVHHARSLILRLSVLVGNLCSIFLQSVPLDGSTAADTDAPSRLQDTPGLQDSMAALVLGLTSTAKALSIDLETAVLKKMELNGKKYPVELCTGKAGKYTDYSAVTNITKDQGQSTLHVESESSATFAKSENFIDALPHLQSAIRVFATARKWTVFHLPRNLVLALLGELGELAELLQWKKDEEQSLLLQEQDKLGQEIADVTIYLIRLADVCGISLKEAVSSSSTSKE